MLIFMRKNRNCLSIIIQREFTKCCITLENTLLFLSNCVLVRDLLTTSLNIEMLLNFNLLQIREGSHTSIANGRISSNDEYIENVNTQTIALF